MTKFLDKLHRAAVTSLIGLTIGTAAIFGSQVYEYLTTTRPSRRKLQKDGTKPSEIPGENLETSS